MPLARLAEPYASDPQKLFALAIWRESRGECFDAKLGVAWTVKNRCAMAPREGFKAEITGNILKPWAFSSFSEGDPNAIKYPTPDDSSWHESIAAAASVEADPTLGAVFYYSLPLTTPPAQWGNVEHSATIGGLQFYRIKG